MTTSTNAPLPKPEVANGSGAKNGRGFKWGCLVAIGLFMGGGVAAYLWWPKTTNNGGERPNKLIAPLVQAQPASKGDLPIYLNALGTVTSKATVTVRSRVDGQLMKLLAQEGATVAAGDLLAEIDPRPYEVQLAQAKGQLSKDLANLKNAELDLARYTDAGDAATQQQRDTATSQVEQYKGAIATDLAAIESAKLQLTYCHITAPISGVVGLHQVDAGNMVHASDSTGLLVLTQLDPINVIFSLPQDQLPLLQKALGTDNHLEVDVYGKTFSPNKPETPLAQGQVTAWDNQIDVSTGTLKIKAICDNKEKRLFPNQFVNVRIKVNTLRDVVLIKTAAVQRSDLMSFVYVARNVQDSYHGDVIRYSEPKINAELRKVTVLATEGELTAVAPMREAVAQINEATTNPGGDLAKTEQWRTGVNPGELVVTDGVDKIRPGLAIMLSGRTGKSASTQRGQR